MMEKRNRMIMFAVIAVIIVAAPISIYETLSPQPIPQISYSSHNLTYTMVANVSYYSYGFYRENLTAYSNITQNGGNVSTLQMVVYFNPLYEGGKFFMWYHVNISGIFQSDLHPSEMLINLNQTAHRDGIFCILLGRNYSMNTSAERSGRIVGTYWGNNLHPTVNVKFLNDTLKGNGTYRFYICQWFSSGDCSSLDNNSISDYLPINTVITAVIEGLSENVMLSENITLELTP